MFSVYIQGHEMYVQIQIKILYYVSRNKDAFTQVRKTITIVKQNLKDQLNIQLKNKETCNFKICKIPHNTH